MHWVYINGYRVPHNEMLMSASNAQDFTSTGSNMAVKRPCTGTGTTFSCVSKVINCRRNREREILTSQVVQPFQSFPPHWSQCFDLHPPLPGVLVGGLGVVVLDGVGRDVVDGRIDELGLGELVGGIELAVDLIVELALVVDGLGGGGLPVGLPGVVPPLVGVSTSLPSQYTVGPSSAKFFRTLLIRLVPGPVQRFVLAAAGFRGFGYST
jgi:hypothetical protein